MSSEQKIICVGCPMGCLVVLTVDNGEVVAINGNECKQGETYVLEEYRNPVRILTTTLLTHGSSQPLLPVKTAKAIPKTKMVPVAVALAKTKVKPPINIGDVVYTRPAGIEVDIVATADLFH